MGSTVTLNASGGTIFAWTPGVTLNDSTIANPTATPVVTTLYHVVVTDANACSNNDSVLVTINPLPIINAGLDTAICFGDTTQLLASGGISYVWSPATGLSNTTIANPLAFPTNTTTFIVVGTDINSCVATDSVLVTINPLPTINAGTDLWLCIGDSVQLNASGGISYLWTPSLGLSNTTIFNPFAFPLIPTNYTVTGIDANGCAANDTIFINVGNQVPITMRTDTTICLGDSVLLGGNPTSINGTTFAWFPTGSLDNSTLANPTAFPTLTTTYYVVATNDTCTTMDSITITVNVPIINAGLDTAICFGDTTQLLASGGISYVWSPATGLSNTTIANPLAFPTNTTTFIVVGTDINSCVATDSVLVTINPLPTINAGADVSLCKGDSVQLNATGGVTYNWSPNTNISNPNVSNPFVYPTTTSIYYVNGIDVNSCTNSDSIVISVFTIPSLVDTSMCIGDSMQLIVLGPANATYNWTPITDLSNPTIFNPYTSTQVTITYFVTVQDTSGCTDTTSITVSMQSKPVVDFTVATSPACEGILADFTNLSTSASNFLWNFGDGNNSTEINPSHIFAYGNITITTLTAYSNIGCSDTMTYTLNAGNFEEQFNLTPPTVLTPNGDGINDLFRLGIPSAISSCTNIEIFNRWGMKVFESKGQNVGWNGRTTAGIKVPAGTYFYVVSINGIIKKGSITLLR